MALKKINHYSITNNISVHDEEAMTALELAGRTAAKVNDAVEAFNELEERTIERLDKIPEDVAADVEKHITDGDFDDQINEYIGDLEGRVDHLLGSVETGSTSGDAELIDARYDYRGITHANLGTNLRANATEVDKRIKRLFEHTVTLSHSSAVKWTANGAGGCTLEFNDVLNLRDDNNATKALPWSEYASGLGSAIVIDGIKATITMTKAQSALVFNIKDQKFYIRSSHNVIYYDDIIVLEIGYTKPVGGTIMPQILHDSIAELDAKIEKLPTGNGGGVNIFELDDEKIAAINSEIPSYKTSFMLFSDPHLCHGSEWESNFNKYMDTLKEYFNRCNVDFVVCLGDWLTQNDAKDVAIAKLSRVRAKMRECFGDKFHLVVGNHDTNYQGAVKLTDEEIGAIWYRDNDSKSYYHFEINGQHFFVLDAGVDMATELSDYQREQLKWVADTVWDKNIQNHAKTFFVHMYEQGGSGVPTVHPFMANLAGMMGQASGDMYPEDTELYDFMVDKGYDSESWGYGNHVFAGHMHRDNYIPVDNNYGIFDVRETTELQQNDVPAVDLIGIPGNATVTVHRIGKNRMEG